ncbi:MAG: bifunctional riboflavin kinase/FAD synthetase [Ferrimonas sp.]
MTRSQLPFLVRGIHNLTLPHQGCVLTIGNFDGVHRGHQAVISQLVAKAKMHQVPAMVMLFEPQPQEYFAPAQAPARLSSLRDKLRRLAALGIDHVLCIKFNAAFAHWDADRFIDELLVARLGVRHLVVGDDFHFGQQRRGNFALLRQAGQQHGFTVQDTASCVVGQQRISSTLIRQAIALGAFDRAAQMLGYRYVIDGRVSHGNKLGRTLSFPTANLGLQRLVSPLRGVYAVRVKLADGQRLLGVANVGTRPTVQGKDCRLEVHIFNFSGEIYGQRMEVELVAWLRDEQRFESITALKAQISADVDQAKRRLSASEYSV